MLYMVEMDFRNPAREADWHVWYLGHVAKHDVVSGAVFDSAEYRANGGPASTGEWQAEHTNWYRNLFAGIDNTPEVPPDAHLLMLEGGAKVPAPYATSVTRLESAGLDRTSKGRGIAIVPAGRLTARLFDLPGVRVFKPITPRISQ